MVSKTKLRKKNLFIMTIMLLVLINTGLKELGVSTSNSSKNIENLTPLNSVSYVDTTGNAYSVFVSGVHAYVAADASGLAIIDITDPENPGSPVFKDTLGNALGVYVSGNYAYVATDTSGLAIIDVTNPASPGDPIYKDTTGNAYSVFVSGNYAYVADFGSGLAIMDVSDPSDPGDPIYKDTDGDARDVFVSGDIAYLADSASGLALINISNPILPSDPIYEDTDGFAQSVYYSSDYAYVADYGSGLAIINVTDPTDPGLPVYEDTTGIASGVFVVGVNAYVADYESGIAAFDVTDPTDPGVPEYADTLGYSQDVFVVGNYAYIADHSSGLVIIGVSGGLEDTDNPVIYTPEDVTYEFGSTDNLIEWVVFDEEPDSYEVFIDEVGQGVQVWDVFPITIDIDGYALGTYNVTLWLNDTTGNYNQDQVDVTVEDTTNPVISSPIDFTYQLGSTGNSINWTFSDLLPGNYEVFVDEVGQGIEIWSIDTIEYDVDGYGVGTYNVTLLINDTSGNFVQDQVDVTVEDNANPTINSPSDVLYEYASSGNSITWTVSDSLPDSYQVFVDEVSEGVNVWDTSTIEFDLDGLGLVLGVYNVTLWLNDTTGNSNQDQVDVTVEDITDPILDEPADFSYQLNSTGNTITWTVSDSFRNYSQVFVDNVSQGIEVWDSSPIIFDVDGYDLGEYNITLWLNDTSGNWNQDQVDVTVVDQEKPIINSPANITYEFGSTGNLASWDVSDQLPAFYEFYVDGVGQGIEVWDVSPTTINFDIDDLDLGIHNVTLWLEDTNGNWNQNQTDVTVEDNINPIVNTPADVTYEYGSSGNFIAWTASDLLQASYEIFLNDVSQGASTWNESTVVISVDGLDVGLYTVKVVINDTTGNEVFDEVNVTVADTTAPIINSPSDVFYTVNTTGHYITWTCSDLREGTFHIYIDGVDQGEEIWESSEITLSIDGLTLGDHNITLIVYDLGGLSAQDSVEVKVEEVQEPESFFSRYMSFLFIGGFAVVSIVGGSIYSSSKKRKARHEAEGDIGPEGDVEPKGDIAPKEDVEPKSETESKGDTEPKEDVENK